MIITYYGKQFFKLQLGDTVLAFNPISKNSKLKGSRFGADVALISVNHQDFDGVEMVSHGDREPLALTGPGEYETKGIFIKGLLNETVIDDKPYINTIYTLTLDGIKVCFLGAVNSKNLSPQVKEAIDEVDVLFTPVNNNIKPEESYGLAVSLEPKIIIPMDYEGEDSASLKVFLKEGGIDKAEAVEKLTIKRKDLEGKEGEIVLLSSNN